MGEYAKIWRQEWEFCNSPGKNQQGAEYVTIAACWKAEPMSFACVSFFRSMRYSLNVHKWIARIAHYVLVLRTQQWTQVWPSPPECIVWPGRHMINHCVTCNGWFITVRCAIKGQGQDISSSQTTLVSNPGSSLLSWEQVSQALEALVASSKNVGSNRTHPQDC